MKKTGRIKLKEDNRGSAMITAIVVGVVMMAFALSLLAITYTLYAQTARRTVQIQCRYLAESVGDDLKSEIEDKESHLYKVLASHVYKVRAGSTIHTGTWKAQGVNATEASETMEYKLDTKGDEDLKDYEISVSFRYVQGLTDDEEDVAGGETEYDAHDVNKSDLVLSGELSDDYDDMASNDVASGGGACTVIMDITCKRGDTVCNVTREAEVTF